MLRLYHAVVSHEDLAQAYGRCWARPSYNSVDAPGPVSLHSRCYGQSYGRGIPLSLLRTVIRKRH